jgi:DNA-binding CsgD family transcriptional regulator
MISIRTFGTPVKAKIMAVELFRFCELALPAVPRGAHRERNLLAGTWYNRRSLKSNGMLPYIPLSKREKEVLTLVLQGKSNKQIAFSLGISVSTVEFHLNHVYTKFQVGSRVELILKLNGSTNGEKIEKLGYSIVDQLQENTENGARFNPQMDWATFTKAVSIIGKELIMKAILKNPSAFLPLAMSLGALVTVTVYVALFGTARQTDEGTAAHIWQILMAGQIPIIFFFAIKWLPRTPKQALLVLLLQAGAAFLALTPVYLLRF